jgi:hypothetical protein
MHSVSQLRGGVRAERAATVRVVADSYRRTLPLMRFVLLAGAVLTFLAGIQLFVLSDRTAEYFSWTIKAGSTAALLGAFYWTAALLAFLSWRRPYWAEARAGVVGVMFLLWAMVVTIVTHLGEFALAGSPIARASAWIWLILYICYPILVTWALVLQLRAPGSDPPRTAPLSTAYRLLLGVSGGTAVIAGTLLLIVPQVAASFWATPLKPLAARSIGSWVLAVGVVYLAMMLEDDVMRIRQPAIASVVGATLVLVVTARYRSEFSWDGLRGLFLLVVALPAGVGLAGILAGRSGAGGGLPPSPAPRPGS